MKNILYYGDNLEVLRKYIKDETVDLCYIDPPFNSKRNYNQIYNNIGKEDRAQTQAFLDTWTWDSFAIEGYNQIITNHGGIFTAQTIELINGLRKVIKEGSLLAYLVSMTLRIAEIHRVLKPTGSFYLHCDPTASHYLKLILDTVFVSRGGDFRNEIIWHYRRWTGKAKHFQKLHDVIFFYTKSEEYYFNPLPTEYTEGSKKRKLQGVLNRFKEGEAPVLVSDGTLNENGVRDNDVWQIPFIAPSADERLGYPTQKPEKLLEKIIHASCPPDGLVLDAYCGCGTTVSRAQSLGKRWIGIDITYQAIAVILKRLEDQFSKSIASSVELNGIPKDMESAVALANKADDRVRKEFEKWSILTYTLNRAIINEKKGADKGIDGVSYFQINADENGKIILQVKSGGVSRSDISTLRGDMSREGAEMGIFITLKTPTKPMLEEAKSAGVYFHPLMNKNYDRIQIVTIQEILEDDRRIDIPMNIDVLKSASISEDKTQTDLFDIV